MFGFDCSLCGFVAVLVVCLCWFVLLFITYDFICVDACWVVCLVVSFLDIGLMLLNFVDLRVCSLVYCALRRILVWFAVLLLFV